MRYIILLVSLLYVQEVTACTIKWAEPLDNVISCQSVLQRMDSTDASFIEIAEVVKHELSQLRKQFALKVVFGSTYDQYVEEATEKGNKVNEAWKNVKNSPMDPAHRREFLEALDSLITFAVSIRN